jgi:hypothetical protein
MFLVAGTAVGGQNAALHAEVAFRKQNPGQGEEKQLHRKFRLFAFVIT